LKQLEDEVNVDCKPRDGVVGLTNMGATCYANTLLQIWFHDPTLRDAIFRWHPAAHAEGK
jgi:ubiquitin carboxyl-terminal hydrolase 48